MLSTISHNISVDRYRSLSSCAGDVPMLLRLGVDYGVIYLIGKLSLQTKTLTVIVSLS
jgi:hypothetical protein